MAYSALISIKAAEAEAEEIVAKARKDAARQIRESSEQAKQIISTYQEQALTAAKQYRAAAGQEASAEAKQIEAETAGAVQQILAVDKSRQDEVLRFVAEGIVKRYVFSSDDQDRHSNS